MKRNKQPRRGKRLLLAAFLVFAVIVGGLVGKKYYDSAHRQLPPPVESATTIMVTLFFADDSGEGLVREGREIEVGADTPETMELVINELTSGPVGSYGPVVPDSTRVRAITLQGEEAVVDFGREFYDNMPAGSSAEMTAVYAVVDTIAANFPQVKKVLFLKEGQPVSTIKGHLDLSRPLPPDFSLEKKPTS